MLQTKYEDVKHITDVEYFKGNVFSIDAANKKYKAHKNESYIEAIKRVCDNVASIESTLELQNYWSERWFDEIFNQWWHPAGSIMQGAGCGRKVSLMNCTTLSLGANRDGEEWDNLESIIKNGAYSIAKCAAHRQGLGMHFSRLRPRQSKVNNASNESDGAVRWMQLMDSIGYYVGQKGRIPAMLFSLSCDHPDVEEFITCKADYTKIQNANISVQCFDKFYEAVINDDDWELVFEIPSCKKGDKIYVDVHSSDMDTLKDEKGYYFLAVRDREGERISKTVKARKLCWMIAENMEKNAEPGIQNIDIARKYSNSDYVYDPLSIYDSRILSTNACSEQYLSRDSMCDLGSLLMSRFNHDPKYYIQELAVIAPSVCRFLDNVNELELRNKTYATPHQRLGISMLRRIGAGYTDIAGWLFKQNMIYGESEANDRVAEFTKWYNYYLYKTSIELGKEKGNFGLFNQTKFENSPFVKRMKAEFGLEFTHMRNVTCSSIAPTGTLSLMFRDMVMSYGIEQAFGIYFWKRTRMSGKYEYYFCVPHAVRETFKQAGYPIPMSSDTIKDTWDGKYGKPIAKFIDDNIEAVGIRFKKSADISPFDKLDLMGKVMKWVDSSISVTYMLPENSKTQDVYDFIIEAWKREVKSVAAFPDRKMYGIVAYEPFQELAVKLLTEGVQIHEQNFTEDELKYLGATRSKITKSEAPKRPDDLPCDIYRTIVDHTEYFVIIGLMGGDPYEVFAGKNIDVNDEDSLTRRIPTKVKNGIIRKAKRGHYQLVVGGTEIVCENITDHISDTDEAIARLVSTALRHGSNIEFIVSQLEKTKGSTKNFAKCIARILKKYIKDGEKAFGDNCPNCKAQLVRNAGCKECTNCSYSACY